MNVDANAVVDNLCRIISQQAREIAILKAKLDSIITPEKMPTEVQEFKERSKNSK